MADDPAKWNSLFKDDFVASLGFTDGLDGINGNTVLLQIGLFNGDDGEIIALADLLLDDRLQIDTSIAVCTDAYLAVEVGNTSLCGGRTLEDDVIDSTLGAIDTDRPHGPGCNQ